MCYYPQKDFENVNSSVFSYYVFRNSRQYHCILAGLIRQNKVRLGKFLYNVVSVLFERYGST